MSFCTCDIDSKNPSLILDKNCDFSTIGEFYCVSVDIAKNTPNKSIATIYRVSVWKRAGSLSFYEYYNEDWKSDFDEFTDSEILLDSIEIRWDNYVQCSVGTTEENFRLLEEIITSDNYEEGFLTYVDARYDIGHYITRFMMIIGDSGCA